MVESGFCLFADTFFPLLGDVNCLQKGKSILNNISLLVNKLQALTDALTYTGL